MERRVHPLVVHAQNREEFAKSPYKGAGLYENMWVAYKNGVVIDADSRHIDLHKRIIAAQGRNAQFVTIIANLPTRSEPDQ